MFRLVFSFVLALLACPVLSADGGMPSVQPGQYIRQSDSGRMIVKRAGSGELRFEIESVGSNCHTCEVSGSVNGWSGQADGQEGSGEPACQVAFKAMDGGVEVGYSAIEPCRTFCGARAGFAGLYRTAPASCTPAAQRAQRERFARQYRSRQFAKAEQTLTGLLSQCEPFIHWIALDEIRNDLALAQLRQGQPQACLQTLAKVPAAEHAGEAELEMAYPPCDFTNYLPTAKAAWHNKSLCEKAGRGGK
jgi:hypothetical protein